MNASGINTEQTILRNIMTDEKYMRKVLPFVKTSYFEGVYKVMYTELGQYVMKYNKLPTMEAFKVEIDNSDKWSDENYRSGIEILPDLFSNENVDEEWLLNTTEKWCQDKALYNSIMESIAIIDGKHEELTKTAIPSILTDALSISFDTNIGHSYIDDAQARYDYYHTDAIKVPFDIELLNTITQGGVAVKTLNVILAGTGVGKSLAMCHMAAANISAGSNVLYITMEMSEEMIAERIDANLMDIDINEIKSLSRDMFSSRISSIKKKTEGNLIIKEYPTGSANSSHFRALLTELKLKKQFVPDIIYVDYLNICASSRMKMGGSINTYSLIKSIAEELRGLGVEHNVPIMTATQVTRSGFDSTDIDLGDTSESFGLPATADLMIAMMSNEDLENDGKVVFKQLKNRYNDTTIFKRFAVGIDRTKMRLFDSPIEDTRLVDAGHPMGDDPPPFDNSNISSRFRDFKIEA